MMEVQTGTEENNMMEITLQGSLNGRSVVYNGAYALLMTLMSVAE
jgi:hypothetical protein